MKLYTILLIIASLVVHTKAAAADGKTSESDQRDLAGARFTRMQRRKQNLNKNKPNNDWKQPEEKHNMMKFALTENDCQYNYTSSNKDDEEDDKPINSDGERMGGTQFKAGSYVFKRCELYYKGQDHMYYGPMKAGTTESTCLVTSITAVEDNNDANFLCSISDELTYSKYDNYGNNWGKEGIYLHNANVHYTSTLKSQGKQIGWGNNFKAATIGGTGGGIKASGQMDIKESGYKNQYVHLYYISAPYLEKSLPW